MSGDGDMALGSGAYTGSYTFKSRFEDGAGTNPEELIAAAEAGCFSMALSHGLATSGHKPERVTTTAKVHLKQEGDGFVIPLIELDMEAVVPGIDESAFQAAAADAKKNCPVSKALAGPEIRLSARLVK
jgi:osmotically inducible protein OsmC